MSLSIQERQDRLLLENSIERVINTSMTVASRSNHEDAGINFQDWIDLKWLVVRLWDEARTKAFERALSKIEKGTPKGP